MDKRAKTFVSSCPNNDIQEKRKRERERERERENSHAENKETWTMDQKLCNCDGLKRINWRIGKVVVNIIS